MTVDELQDFFSKVKLEGPIQLGPGEQIVNPDIFLEGHFNVVKNYGTDSQMSVPFIARLTKVYNLIKAGQVSVIYLE
ncbi:DUF6965 family protein [Mucilaginibacter endophyticus]|uniref:DUF6965 family protein n=1 Tax=Mucilaginibacter endophyticus TaxID=2675003 RepID=UPI000E0D30D6|nr:hypothetical protein [Mucilaginibacter endophyticus]